MQHWYYWPGKKTETTARVYHQVTANSILYITDPHRPLPHAKRPAYRVKISRLQVEQTISHLNAGNLARWHYGDPQPRWSITPPVGSTGRVQIMNCCLLSKIRMRHVNKLVTDAGWRDCDVIKTETLKTVKVVPKVRGCVKDSKTHDVIRYIVRVSRNWKIIEHASNWMGQRRWSWNYLNKENELSDIYSVWR